MGTWGTAIFSDDTASDVRNDFRELIGDGLSPEQATARLMTEYGSIVDNPEGGTTFWLGLAVTQWKCGRLQDSVKQRALEIIDSGADLEFWSEDAKLAKARAAVLAKTRAQLLSPQPAAKRIAKTFREANDWEVGELISYRTAAGKHLVFRVVGHHVHHGRSPQVHILDYYEDAAPTLDQARQLAPRIVVTKDDIHYQPYGRFFLYALSERELPKKRLTPLGLGKP